MKMDLYEKILAGEEKPVSYTHLRAHETDSYLVCRLLLEKKKKKNYISTYERQKKNKRKQKKTKKCIE